MVTQSKIPENKTKKKKHTLPDAARPYMWQPGQSGNPGGRPKKKPITEMFERMLEDPGMHESIASAMLNIFRERSGIAKVMLLKDMAERVEGKVTQPIEADVNLTATLSDKLRKARERSAGNG